MRLARVYLLILDGLGVGGAPDAEAYGDAGSDTLAHVACTAELSCTALEGLGLGNLYPDGLPGLRRTDSPESHHARLTEVSRGKDTTTGHFELMGLVRDSPAPTFLGGFPAEFLKEFSRRVGRGVLGNRPASGTVIIQELGEGHLATGELIVYTSADSVFQVAAHTDVVPLAELYRICETAREMLTGSLAVDRVIARPFTGSAATGFTRTADRRDYALPPPAPTTLDELFNAGLDVIAVGKVSDIFSGQGITRSFPVHGNPELMAEVERLARVPDWHGLLLCNLVDFDMLFGHRNDPEGYAAALTAFDAWLATFRNLLTGEDLLFITADHGNDPTNQSTDHSREQVPLLITSRQIALAGGRLSQPPPGFFHVGRTVTAALGVETRLPGVDLLSGTMSA